MSRKFPLPSVKIVARIAGVAVTMEHLVNVPQEERDVPIAGRQRPPVSVEKIFDAMLMILAWCVKCGVLDCRTLGVPLHPALRAHECFRAKNVEHRKAFRQ